MSRASTSVLRVPELVHNIAKFMSQGDLVQVVTVSKVFHRSVAPWIWETVYGVAPLFRLLPCTESKKSLKFGKETYRGTFTFSKPLSQSDLTRLDFYAPFVKHLALLTRTKDLKIVAGWEVLIDYIRAGHTLLPNLITLELKPPNGIYNEIPPYLWAILLCSPCLKSIAIDERLGGISPRIGSALLGYLANRCPNLDTLEFQLVEHRRKSGQDKHMSLKMDTGDHIPRFLQSASLSNLVISSFFANRYFLEISQIPRLERLEMHDSGSNEIAPISLPATSFPALRELKFLNLDVLEVESFWGINELVGRLAVLECAFYPMSEDDDDTESLDAAFHFPLRFSNTLCSSSPHITDLALNFDSEGFGMGEASMSLEADVLQALARLPLRKLSVDGAGVDLWSGESESPSACELLASTFPSLEVLRWPCQAVKYQELPVFTSMPNLRHLAVGLSLRPQNHDISGAFSGIHYDHPLRVLEADMSTHTRANSRADWYRVARYLVGIWPGVQLTPQVRGPSFGNFDESRLSDDQYRILNEFMLQQRGLDDVQANDLWLSVSEEWFATRFPERPDWWSDEE
ncbi:hypothetical protein BDV93DRAFT_526880 [Ceratobasidium sp. AG-I]|nr:hypothetical protein BDV93DRAFT_526880 [Ceratobasidium sp. AG-I]